MHPNPERAGEFIAFQRLGIVGEALLELQKDPQIAAVLAQSRTEHLSTNEKLQATPYDENNVVSLAEHQERRVASTVIGAETRNSFTDNARQGVDEAYLQGLEDAA